MRADHAPYGASAVGAFNLTYGARLCDCDRGQFEVQVVTACHISAQS